MPLTFAPFAPQRCHQCGILYDLQYLTPIDPKYWVGFLCDNCIEENR